MIDPKAEELQAAIPAGIISCLAYSPMADGLLAAGAYSGTAAMYDTRTMGATCILAGHSGGITQVSPHRASCCPRCTVPLCHQQQGTCTLSRLCVQCCVCCVAHLLRNGCSACSP